MTSQERHLLITLARIAQASGLGNRDQHRELALAMALVKAIGPAPRPQHDGASQDGWPASVEFTETGPTLSVFGVAVCHWDGILHDSLASTLRDQVNAAAAQMREVLKRYRYATRASLSAMFADGRASAVPLMWARAHDDGSKDINAEALHAQLEQWAKEKRSGAPAFVPEGTTTQALQLIWSYRYAVHRALRVMFGRGGDAARPLTWALDRDVAHNVFDDAPLLRDFEEWNKKTPLAPSAASQDAEVLARYRYAAFFATTMSPALHNGASRRLAWARSKDPAPPVPISAMDGLHNEFLAAPEGEKGARPPTAPDNPTRAGGKPADVRWGSGRIPLEVLDEIPGVSKAGERILTPLEMDKLRRAARRTGPEERAAQTDTMMEALGGVSIMSLDKDGRLHVDQEALDKLIKDVVHSWISKPGAWMPRREPASEFDPSQLRVEPLMRPVVFGQAGHAVPWIEDMTPEELREIADDLMAFAGHNMPRSVHRTQKRAERCRQIAGLLEAARSAGHLGRDLKAENTQLQLVIDEAFKILDAPGAADARSACERARLVLMTALSPAAPAPAGVVSSWQEEAQRLRGIIRDAHKILTAFMSSPEECVSAAVACMIPGLTPPVVQPPEEEPVARPPFSPIGA